MELVYERLLSRAQHLKLQHCSSSSSNLGEYRILVALAGPPGSGKSTIAAEVVRRLNDLPGWGKALVLPMDGFHLSRAALGAMVNSDEAFERRGTHWTFDADGVVRLVEALHETRSSRSVVHLAPSFDHALKDPIKDAIEITPEINFIVMEGNWLLFDEEPWSRISQVVDDTWFVDVDSASALKRIAQRHLQCEIENCWQDAVARAERNDMVNGDLVRAKLIAPSIKVQSVPN